MLQLDRRFDHRVPLEMFLNTYVDDRPRRAFTLNVSESGLYLSTLAGDSIAPRTPLGLEFVLPGERESIWAAGELCFDAQDDYFSSRGVRFVGMARLHARMLREYLNRVRLRRILGPRRT